MVSSRYGLRDLFAFLTIGFGSGCRGVGCDSTPCVLSIFGLALHAKVQALTEAFAYQTNRTSLNNIQKKKKRVIEEFHRVLFSAA